MVKTDDYMESSAADFDMKEKEEIMTGGEEDGNMHRNWQPPRRLVYIHECLIIIKSYR
jgi:hypothetical protein